MKTLISWIGRHSDVEGNNIADNVARNGALSTTDIPDSKITLKTAKKIILDSAMEHWQKNGTTQKLAVI